MNQQPGWVLENLEATQLPDGFARSAANKEVDLVDFDDPAIDFEFVFYPGTVIFQEYWQILCDDKGIRGVTQLVRGDDNRELAKNIVVAFISTLGTPISWTPFLVVFACIVAYEGLKSICSDYQ
jgi:hypothetical protein